MQFNTITNNEKNCLCHTSLSSQQTIAESVMISAKTLLLQQVKDCHAMQIGKKSLLVKDFDL